MNAVAINIRCPTGAIRHLRQRYGTHNNRISAETVRNRLREGGLSARCPYVGCVLARSQRVNRVTWTLAHKRWLRQQWNNVLFSDKSRFTIHRGDGRVREYRSRNERYADVAYLNEIVLGVGVLSWSGRALHMASH